MLYLEGRGGQEGARKQGKRHITKYMSKKKKNTIERNLPLYSYFHQIWLLELQEMEELLYLIIFRKDRAYFGDSTKFRTVAF